MNSHAAVIELRDLVVVIAQSRNTMATQQTLNVDVKQYPGPQTAARHVNKVKCPGKFFDCQCRAGQVLVLR